MRIESMACRFALRVATKQRIIPPKRIVNSFELAIEKMDKNLREKNPVDKIRRFD